MAYSWNIGVFQADDPGTTYQWNVGVDQTSVATAIYVDAETTVVCTSSLTISAEVLETTEASITITCESSVVVSVTANIKPTYTTSRLFAAGNNSLWYET